MAKAARLSALAASVAAALIVAGLAPTRGRALSREEPVACGGVEGVWRSRTDVSPSSAEMMTVRIRRARRGYVGDARTEAWHGPPGSSPPLGCVPALRHTVLTAPMVATFADGVLRWRIKPGAPTTVDDACGHTTSQMLNGASFGPVDLAAGIFEATFVYDAGSEHMRWLHVSCTP